MLLTRCLLLWLQSYHWFNLRRNFSLFNSSQRMQLTQFVATRRPFWWMSVEMSEHRWMKSYLIHLCFFSFGGPITASVWGRLTAGQRHLRGRVDRSSLDKHGTPKRHKEDFRELGIKRRLCVHSYQVAKVTPISAEGEKKPSFCHHDQPKTQI